MKSFFSFIYLLSLSLWLGGLVALGFVVTPPLFKSLGIDKAAEITGIIFPVFFSYILVLTIVSLLSFFLSGLFIKAKRKKIILGLLVGSFLLAGLQNFYILPKAEMLRDQVGVFATTPKSDPVRKEFGKFHGMSNGFNLLLMLAAMGLLYLKPKEEN